MLAGPTVPARPRVPAQPVPAQPVPGEPVPGEPGMPGRPVRGGPRVHVWRGVPARLVRDGPGVPAGPMPPRPRVPARPVPGEPRAHAGPRVPGRPVRGGRRAHAGLMPAGSARPGPVLAGPVPAGLRALAGAKAWAEAEAGAGAQARAGATALAAAHPAAAECAPAMVVSRTGPRAGAPWRAPRSSAEPPRVVLGSPQALPGFPLVALVGPPVAELFRRPSRGRPGCGFPSRSPLSSLIPR
jgi:hypothetical protein